MRSQDIEAQENEYCDFFNTTLSSGFNKSYTVRVFYVAVAFLSIVSLQTIMETIRRNSKQNKHPAELILVMCVVESAFCF